MEAVAAVEPRTVAVATVAVRAGLHARHRCSSTALGHQIHDSAVARERCFHQVEEVVERCCSRHRSRLHVLGWPMEPVQILAGGFGATEPVHQSVHAATVSLVLVHHR
jgi:hypothetical protein